MNITIGKGNKKDNILFMISINKFDIVIFNCWLGFEYKNFKHMGKRLDFGFIKFWLNK